MPPHFLSNFEIQKYYQIKPKFNGVYPRNNLTKIKDRSCVLNLEDRKSINAHWIALYVNGYNGSVFYDTTYFDRLGTNSKRHKKIHRKQKYHKKYL